VAWQREVRVLRHADDTVVIPRDVATFVRANLDLRALLLVHTEIGTGAHMDLAAVAAAVHSTGHMPLLVVDVASSLGAAPIQLDNWGLDAAVGNSQKALGGPVGLAFAALSERAMDAVEHVSSPRFARDLRMVRRYAARYETPYAVSTPLLGALTEALRLLHEEGLQRVYDRHRTLSRLAYGGVRAAGLVPQVPQAMAAPGVTVARLPVGLDSQMMREELERTHGVLLADGRGALAGKTVRIGHLGPLATEQALTEALAAMRLVVHEQVQRRDAGRCSAAPYPPPATVTAL